MKKSFTLIETIIAIGIFLTGILSFATLIYLSAKLITRQQDLIIMQNLAQEGIEIVRNLRDVNWLKGQLFDTGLDTGSYILDFSGAGYELKLYNNVPLKLRNLSGISFYTYSNYGNPLLTKFYRKITITKSTDGSYLTVSSAVSNNPDFSNAYVLEDKLYDWYQSE